MGDTQSTTSTGQSNSLLTRISNDIGSGNEGDMLDMQCTVNQDPDLSAPSSLFKKTKDSSLESLSKEEAPTLSTEESMKHEDFSTSLKKSMNPEEEDEIEQMFKMME